MAQHLSPTSWIDTRSKQPPRCLVSGSGAFRWYLRITAQCEHSPAALKSIAVPPVTAAFRRNQEVKATAIGHLPRIVDAASGMPEFLQRERSTIALVGYRELALTNPMGELNATERDRRRRKRLEPEHRRAASLDRAVILLNDIIEISACPHVYGVPAQILLAEQPQAAVRSGVSIEIDLLRPSGPCDFDRLAKELLRRFVYPIHIDLRRRVWWTA